MFPLLPTIDRNATLCLGGIQPLSNEGNYGSFKIESGLNHVRLNENNERGAGEKTM